MKDALTTTGAVLLVAACCLLPLLIIGGLNVLAGAVWREAALALIGVAILVLAFGGAAVRVRHRRAATVGNKQTRPRGILGR